MMTLDLDHSLMRAQTAPQNAMASPRLLPGNSSRTWNASHSSLPQLIPISTTDTPVNSNSIGQQTTLNDSPTVSSPGGNLLSAPVANDSLMNKQADASKSLYQICLKLKSRLQMIPGMDRFLGQYEDDPDQPGMPADPVYTLWQTFRYGAPLILLWNTLHPKHRLEGENDLPDTVNKKKDLVFRFLKAVNTELYLSGDDTFIITHLFSDDTNNFVKVIRVVERVMDELESKGMIQLPDNGGDNADKEPLDTRERHVKELLTTERKYVQDLETVQDYMHALQSAEIVSNDVIHALFLNLNSILDFQRRFLIKLETMYDVEPDKQRFGSLLVSYETAFGIYDNFCMHFKSAVDLATVKQNELNRVDHPLTKETLAAYLIKPPQRITKYPLLLESIIKHSPKDDPRIPDLEEGTRAARRILDRANEALNKAEMAILVEELKDRVEDWKGHDLAHFGELLCSGQFTVVKGDAKGDVEREIFLFEKILLCCKEVGTNKKQSKTMSMSRKVKPKQSALQLKGRIFMQNVTDIISLAKGGSYTLQIFWKGDPGVENFIIRHRSDEVLRKWNALIHRQVDIFKREDPSAGRDISRISGSSKHMTSDREFIWLTGADPGDLRRASEGETTEDEDEDDDETPTTAPQPPQRTDSQNGYRAAPGGTHNMFPPPNKPRYPMSNSSSYMQGSNHLSVLTQSPAVQASLAGDAAGGSYFSPTESPMMTPMSAQSRGMSGIQQYPFPRQGTPSSYDDPRNGHAPAMARSTSREGVQGQNGNGHRMQRPSLPGIAQPQSIGQNRMRSASSPNIHNLPVGSPLARLTGMQAPPMPSLPAGYAASNTSTQSLGVNRSGNASPGLPIQHPPPRLGNQSPSLYQQMSHLNTLPENPRANHHQSGSYHDMNRPVDARLQHVGTMHQDYPISTPQRNGTPPGGYPEPPNAGIGGVISASTVRSGSNIPSLKVKLMDRIERKVRLCGGPSYNTSMPLRVRYQDEDGDYITVNSDDDVQMAIESRFHGDDAMGAVTLFVA